MSVYLDHKYGRSLSVPATDDCKIVKDLGAAKAVNIVVQIGGSSPRVVAVTDDGKTHLLCEVGTDSVRTELSEALKSEEKFEELFFDHRQPYKEKGLLVPEDANPNILVELLAHDAVSALEGIGFDWNKLQSICFAAAGGLTKQGAINVPNQTFPLSAIHTQKTFRSLVRAYSGAARVEELPLKYKNDAEAGAEGEAQAIGLKEGEVILCCQWGTGFGGSSKILLGGKLQDLFEVNEFGYSCVYNDGKLEFVPIWTKQKELGCVTPNNDVLGIPHDGTNLEFETAGYGLCRRICEFFTLADLEEGLLQELLSMDDTKGKFQESDLREKIAACSNLTFVSPLRWKDSIDKDFMDLVNRCFFKLAKSEDVSEDSKSSDDVKKLAKDLYQEISTEVAQALGVVVRFAMTKHNIARPNFKIVLGGPIASHFDNSQFMAAVKEETGGVEVIFSTLSPEAREALAFVPSV